MTSDADVPPRTGGRNDPEQQGMVRISRWRIDPEHSEIRFSIRHLVVSTVRGRFTRFRGMIAIDETQQVPASVEVEIDAGSIDTGNRQRDIHLRSGDFFDVESHPTILFVSRQIAARGGNRYQVAGELRLHGVTRDVVLNTTYEGSSRDADARDWVAFSATTQLNRRDFDLNWNKPLETGDALIGDTVRIALDIEAARQAQRGG